ncbi:hypothetical protein LSUE1_G003745 [Lachnellula suecica]|uniref:Aristolochene synthase n=1 Tax=Lachnellula suecica TaxID=602035 RepID=A0A8T9C8H2_9HELO|nr:hypothetical protein LSUE1_G003745 [Lachnellula suecica]
MSLPSFFNWQIRRSTPRPVPSAPSSASDSSGSSGSSASSASTHQTKRNLTKVVSPGDSAHISPIKYAYDPVPEVPQYLSPLPFEFPHYATKSCAYATLNAVKIKPRAAGLPYRSSLDYVRGNKNWKANLDESVKLLELIVADKAALDEEVGKGITLSKIAKKELRPGLEHRMVVATSYMFPFADERRLRQIATLMIMYFVFDDKVEETPEGSPLSNFRTDFLRRFREPSSVESDVSTMSELQHHLDFTVRIIGEEDSISGNGGKEMLEALMAAFHCVHPDGDFHSLEDYLKFRRLNVGARFVIAAAKFSIKSSVDVKDPRFARYLSLVGDHYGIINDMASYDKESKALREGETQDMINIVAVFQTLLSLPDARAAKAAAYGYQLQVEAWIVEEIEALESFGKLSDEDWWFVEAVLLSATGNVFFCMTSSRYGGQAAMIEPQYTS